MTLRFEEVDEFKTNLERFLAHMESEDSEMGAILRAHSASLLSAQDDASRKAARDAFNRSVTSDLDVLLKKHAGKGTG